LEFKIYPNDDPDTAAKKLADDLKKEGWYIDTKTNVVTTTSSKDPSKGNNRKKLTVEENKRSAVPTFKYSKMGKGDLHESVMHVCWYVINANS
jgi:hypothetical protein